MAVSFRTARNLGLTILLAVIFSESIFSYIFVSQNAKRITEVINVNETKLRRWHDLTEVINDAKVLLYDFRLGKIDVIAPVDLLINRAEKEMRAIKDLSTDEEERAGILEILEETKRLRVVIYAYEGEVREGYRGGSSARELEDIAIYITNHIAQLGRGAVAYVSQKIEDENRDIYNVTVFSQKLLGIILLSATLVTVIAAFFMARSLARPIKQLAKGTRRIAEGEFSYRVKVEAKDEIGQLAESFNKMAEELKKSQFELMSEKAYTENIIESMTNSLIVIGTDSLIVTVNNATCNLLGYTEKELIGKPIAMVHPAMAHPEDEFYINSGKISDLSKGTFIRDMETNYLSKDGREIPMRLSASVMRNVENLTHGIVCVALDNTKRKKLEEKLHEISITDELTGLLNRRGFMTLANKHQQVSNREKTPFSLLYADMDGLKWINDNLGHDVGDRALVEISSIFEATFRQSDIISRLGGDEFAVLLTNPSDANDASLVTRRLEENIELSNKQEGREYNLSISIGLVQYDPESLVTLEALMSKADALMYRCKEEKKTDCRC